MSRAPFQWKIGELVNAPHPSGIWRRGRVDGTDILSNGPWVAVNIAPYGENRVLKHYRPSQLRKTNGKA